MIQPVINKPATKSAVIDKFLGLNRTLSASSQEFSDMHNMTCERAPVLTTRRRRRLICSAPGEIEQVIFPAVSSDGFTGIARVDGTPTFYFDGQKKGALTDACHAVADFSGIIVIFPEKLYYSYRADSTGELQSMESTVTASCSFSHTKDTDTDTITNCVRASKIDFADYFKVGDGLTIRGGGKGFDTQNLDSRYEEVSEDAIVSAVVEKIDGVRMYLKLYNRYGVQLAFKTGTCQVSIGRYVPNLSHICVFNNRLWGTHAGDEKTGVGEYIFASMLGNPLNFNTFAGLSSDSWWTEVASPGAFSGITAFENHVIAFKPDRICQVYGDTPSNFSVPYNIDGGCVDARSIAVCSDAVYFLSARGVCRYTGGAVRSVSDKLCREYTAGVAGTDGRRYYLCADGELVVYDTQSGLWAKEDDAEISTFTRAASALYAAVGNKLYQIGAEATASNAEEYSFTSARFFTDKKNAGGVISACLRLEMAPGATARLYISHDEGEFNACTPVISADGFAVRSIPVRLRRCDCWRFRVAGKGHVSLLEVEIVSS